MASLSLRHIYKVYQGGVLAVSDFNLEIDDREFIVFVGPSGCGKSTTLRMIAGLEEITQGELYIDDEYVNDKEPKDRNIAMVFQNYALYPHMTVYDNMAFGLKLRRVPSDIIKQKVNEAAEILGISQLLSRKPKALSGGQRQRVALGRAIVRDPKVFLLDEPLSNLDAKLRVQMRTEITKLHNKLATTFIYVTHDQVEAMTMGTRIVVMKDGFIQQVDTPQSLYDNPVNQFVASFIGTPQMNFIRAKLGREGNSLIVTFGNNKVVIPASKSKKLTDDMYIGKEVIFGVRPEDIHDEQNFISQSPNTVIKANIDVLEKLGNETILYMKADGKEDYLIARVDARCQAEAGEEISVAIDAQHIHLFDADTELSIMGVPQYNFFEAELTGGVGQTSVAKVGKNAVSIPGEITANIISPDYFGSNIYVGISPDAISIDGAGDQKIKGVVDFVEKHPRFLAVYAKVEGKKGYMIAKCPLDCGLGGGKEVQFTVDTSNVMLFDSNTGDTIIASAELTPNVAPATVTKGAETVSIKIGKNTLVYKHSEINIEAGAVTVNIEHYGTDTSAAAVEANPKSVLKGVVTAVDNLRKEDIVFAAVDGFEGNFVARVPECGKLKAGDKVKIYVSPSAIK